MYGTLTPAYGRDYKSQKEVKADWDAGKDFFLNAPLGERSGYANKASFPAGTQLQVRYAKQMKAMMVTA